MAISRRTIILGSVAAGGGLALWAIARRLDDGDAAARFAATTPGATAVNAWVKISAGGDIILGVHRAEMGQGVCTSLPMLLAEELDVDWERVRFEFTPVDRAYYNFGPALRTGPLATAEAGGFTERIARNAFHAMGYAVTLGSTSMLDAWDTVRGAGAAARVMLVAAAARRWAVPAARLQTFRGMVLDPVTGASLDYGELAAAAASEPVPRELPLRDPAAFRLVGTSPQRLDIPAKATGAARFGIDTVLPGMLFAAVRHSPLLGTRIAGIDNAPEVSSLPGVSGVARLGTTAVAVVAADSWTALRAAARLSLKPEPADRLAASSTAMGRTWRRALDDPDPAVFRDEGDVASALQSGPVVEAVFEQPFLAHLCMEPMNCTALVDASGVTLWVGTQAASVARDVAAQVAGVPAAQVTVNQTFLGGGFGRRAEVDFVRHAVGVARAWPGRPVKLLYSREEDLRADMYRPATVARARASLDARGRIAALDYVLVSQSVAASYFRRTPTPRGGDAREDSAALAGAASLPYTGIRHLRCSFQPRETGVPVGFWRSTGYSQNCFVIESFMDELAHAAGQDPLAFRLAHLEGRPQHQAVLRAVAQRSGWGQPLPAGQGRGLAFTESHDSLVAQVVEVAVDQAAGGDGPGYRVLRVTCVIDPRVVIHPDTVVAQMEGGIIDALSVALYGGISIRGGGVEQGNFDACRLLTLAETPEIAVHLLPQGGRPGGVGEPGLPALAPALANALFAATGRRLRSMPLRL